MGSVVLFDAARMQEIEDTTVVTGLVDVDGHLLLEQRNGAQIDAGNVVGPPGQDGYQGSDGAQGPPGPPGVNGTNGTSSLTAGMIIDWPTVAAVPSYACPTDGRAISRSTYSTLFGRIGTQFGVGDGSTTFNVPKIKTELSVIGEIYRPDTAYVMTTAYTDIPSLTVTGVSDGSTVRVDVTQILQNATSGADRVVNLQLLCDGVAVAVWINNRVPLAGGGDARYTFANSMEHTPSAGAHTWKIQAQASLNSAVAASWGSLVINQISPTNYKKLIVITDTGLSPTVIQGGPGLSLGMIVPWPGVAGAPIPANCLELNGQVVSATTYSGLAGLFPSWVSGTNLTLPDLRGTTVAGYLAGDDTFGVLGSFVGEKKHTLLLAEMPAHTHTYASQANIAAGGSYTAPITNAGTPSPTSSVGSGTPHNVVQPTYVGRWLIVAADSAGEYSPTVQAALIGRVGILEQFTGINRPVFRVKHSTVFSRSGAESRIVMPWDMVTVAQGGFWDNVLKRAIAPVAGLYRFETSLVNTAVTVGPEFLIYKNGVLVDQISIAYYQYVASTQSMELILAANDYVEIYLRNNNGTSITIDGTRSYFSGILLEAF